MLKIDKNIDSGIIYMLGKITGYSGSMLRHYGINKGIRTR